MRVLVIDFATEPTCQRLSAVTTSGLPSSRTPSTFIDGALFEVATIAPIAGAPLSVSAFLSASLSRVGVATAIVDTSVRARAVERLRSNELAARNVWAGAHEFMVIGKAKVNGQPMLRT